MTWRVPQYMLGSFAARSHVYRSHQIRIAKKTRALAIAAAPAAAAAPTKKAAAAPKKK